VVVGVDLVPGQNGQAVVAAIVSREAPPRVLSHELGNCRPDAAAARHLALFPKSLGVMEDQVLAGTISVSGELRAHLFVGVERVDE